VALAAGQPVHAQTEASTESASAAAASPAPVTSDQSGDNGGALAEITVTGTHITQKGYTAPTPVTVLDVADMEKSAVTNIPDALNKLPQLTNSRSNTQSIVITPQAPLGGNYLNLRGVGINRVLVLFDGQRLAPTTFEGAVDTNILPQLLMQRVDVVTAGASAGYGSDAVSGVINFILDKKFTGIKGVVEDGLSRMHDDGLLRYGLAAGQSFLDDKLHLEGSFEAFRSDGIDARGKLDRGAASMPLAVGGGTPSTVYHTIYNSRFTTQSFGGVIQSGPLKGMQFLPGGVLAPFNFGTPTGTAGISSGGDGAFHDQMWLTPRIDNKQAFGRVSFDFSPAVSAFAYVNYGESETYDVGATQSVNSTTIYAENAFLTDAQRAMLGTTPSFTIGRRWDEAGGPRVNGNTKNITASTGLDGKFADSWSWNVRYAHSDSRLTMTQQNQIQLQYYAAAVDAVKDPSGNTVCRVTLTNPGLYPGCVPLDLFGAGSMTPAALNYVLRPSSFETINKIDDASTSLAGSPVSLWAGPVNIATGLEYRKASLVQTSTADPALPVAFTGLRSPVANRLFNTGQNGVAQGSNNVKEAFLEVAIPLLKDLPLANALDANGAVRYTDYSTSGSVTTWKAGLNYVPVSGVRFRGTVSRDIRAPTLYELFAGTQFNRATTTDTHTNTTGELVFLSSGNPNLKPEIGDTRTVGVVLQPDFMNGFSASIDYWQLKITGGIAAVDGATVLNQCNLSGGTSAFCSQVIRPNPYSDTSAANFPSEILVQSINLAKEVTKGVDFELSQRVKLQDLFASLPGRLDFHLLASYVPTRTTQTLATQAPYNLAGAIQVTLQQNALAAYPKLPITLQVDYNNGPLDIFLQERYVSKMDRNWNPAQVFQDHIYDPVYYTDMTLTYKLAGLGGPLTAFANASELFLNVNNLFDRKPPLVPDISSPGLQFPSNLSAYDVVGRYITAGFRFRF